MCSYLWSASATHLFGDNPTGCYRCGRKKTNNASTYSQEKVINLINEYKPKNIIIPDNFEYTHSNKDKGIKRGYCNLFCTKKYHGKFKCYITQIYNCTMCPKCTGGISKGEHYVMIYLDNNKISYLYDKSVDDKSVGRFDFQHIDGRNINLEYDGYPSHFDYTKYNSNNSIAYNQQKEQSVIAFINRQLKDKKKNLYCKENNILLIRIPYTINSLIDVDSVLNNIFTSIKNNNIEKGQIIYADRKVYIEHNLKMGKVKCAIKTLQKKFRNIKRNPPTINLEE